jgi:hypothetical protein
MFLQPGNMFDDLTVKETAALTYGLQPGNMFDDLSHNLVICLMILVKETAALTYVSTTW